MLLRRSVWLLVAALLAAAAAAAAASGQLRPEAAPRARTRHLRATRLALRRVSRAANETAEPAAAPSTPVPTPIPTLPGAGQGWSSQVNTVAVLWSVLYYSFLIGFPMVVVFAIIWWAEPGLLRLRARRYSFFMSEPDLGDIIFADGEGFMGWLFGCRFEHPAEERVLETAGVDGALVIMLGETMRCTFVIAGLALFILGFFDAMPDPVHWWGPNSTLNTTRWSAHSSEGLSLYTIANVRAGSGILWVHTLAAAGLSILLMVQLRRGWDTAALARLTWLQQETKESVARRLEDEKKGAHPGGSAKGTQKGGSAGGAHAVTRAQLGGATKRAVIRKWDRGDISDSARYDPGRCVLLTGIRDDVNVDRGFERRENAAGQLASSMGRCDEQTPLLPESGGNSPTLESGLRDRSHKTVQDLVRYWYNDRKEVGEDGKVTKNGAKVLKAITPPSAMRRTLDFAGAIVVLVIFVWIIAVVICGVSPEMTSYAAALFMVIVGIAVKSTVSDEEDAEHNHIVAALVQFSSHECAAHASQVLPGAFLRRNEASPPWNAMLAPAPGRILWAGARLSWWEQIPRKVCASTLALLLAIGFAPLAQIFVNLLANLASIAHSLDNFVDASEDSWAGHLAQHLGLEVGENHRDPFMSLVRAHPTVVNIIQGQLASLLLGTLLMYLPDTLHALAKLGGAVTMDEADEFSTRWFGHVLVFSTAFSGAVSSAVLRQMSGLAAWAKGEHGSEPSGGSMSVGSILDLLGQGAAEQSLTLVGLVLVRALMILPWELVPARVYMVLMFRPVFALLNKIGGVSLMPVLGLSAAVGLCLGLYVYQTVGLWAALLIFLIVTVVFVALIFLVKAWQDYPRLPAWIHYMISQDLLVAFAGITYGPSCPLLVCAAALYFVIAVPIRRFLVMYMYDNYDSGGALWPVVFGQVVYACIIMNVLMVAILLLKMPVTEADGTYATGPMAAVCLLTLLLVRGFGSHWESQTNRFFTIPIGTAKWLDGLEHAFNDPPASPKPEDAVFQQRGTTPPSPSS